MATAPRFWNANYLFTGATLAPSSEATGNPVEALEDQQRTYFWRTATGWTITEHNRYIDFDRGGVKVATVALGTYATGASLATAITAAFEAADATPVWGTDYNVTATNKFTINAGTGFSLLWSSGANAYRSIGRSLGFVVTSDDTAATFYTADGVSYQSTHHLVVTLTSSQATSQTDSAAVIGHNCLLSAGSVLNLESSATNVWSAPTTRATFGSMTGPATATDDVRRYFTSSTHQYWRLVVDDPQNADGYFQLAALYLGTYVTSPFCFSINQSRNPFDFSGYNVAIGGNHFPNIRTRQKRYQYEVAEVLGSSAGAATLRGFFDATPVGQNFILDRDPSVASAGSAWTEFAYGHLPQSEGEVYVPDDYWNFSFQFWESL